MHRAKKSIMSSETSTNSNIQIFKYSNIQIFKYSNIQIFESTTRIGSINKDKESKQLVDKGIKLKDQRKV
jgi:hypothetical protein